MDEKTFDTWINTYGSDLSRWPKDKRDEAKGFLKNTQAQQRLEQERTFDAFLLSSSIEPPEDFLEHLSHNLNEKIENSSFAQLWSPLTPKLAALSLALLLGFFASFIDYDQSSEAVYFDDIALELSQLQGEES